MFRDTGVMESVSWWLVGKNEFLVKIFRETDMLEGLPRTRHLCHELCLYLKRKPFDTVRRCYAW